MGVTADCFDVLADHLEEWLRFVGGRRLAAAGYPVVRFDSTPAFSGHPSSAKDWYLGKVSTRSAAAHTDSTFLATRPQEFRQRTSHLFLTDWRNMARTSQFPLVLWHNVSTDS